MQSGAMQSRSAQGGAVRVGVLGPLLVEAGGRTVEVGGVRLRALLARLALDAGRPVAAGTLVDALWGDTPPADAANALQTLVSRLRRALGDGALVVSGPAGYALAVAPDDVDAVRFVRLVQRARAAANGGGPADRGGALREALGLWRGPALADVAEAPFASSEAERLERLRLACREDLVEAEVAAGRAAAVVVDAETLALEHPLRDRAQALHLRALAASGRRAEALVAYEDLRARLADSLGVDPSAELQALHLDLLRENASAVAEEPPRTVAPKGAPLPAALTSFVGREQEVAELAAVLGVSRLVTLVGPGGAGKTRLSVEVGRGHAREGREVRLVELAPHGADDVATAVADALGVRERVLRERGPGDPVGPAAARSSAAALDRLADAIGSRPVLLLLDNCEHVVDEAARVAEHLLVRCAGLRVVATSREPLRIDGERLHRVGPLRTPPDSATSDEALTHPAVRLLADRAAAVRPGFVVDATTLRPVVEICRRLDGLPLAIELAAARLRSLPPEVLAARLDDRFGLLTGGSRTALPRHQTLRAVVAWSWDLLTDDEREVAAHVAVFAGSFGEDAARAVCPAVTDVPGVLLSLVEKSLLHVAEDVPAAGAPPRDGVRFRMLETIREYGVERLTETGAANAARGRHAAHFLAFAEAAEPRLRAAEQLVWLDRLTVDRPNVLAALRWFVAEGDTAQAVRLGAALAWFWTLRGAHAEAATWLSLVIGMEGDAPPVARTVVVVAHTLNGGASGSVGLPALADGGQEVVRFAAEHADEHPMLMLVEPGLAMMSGDFAGATAAIERLSARAEPWARAALHLFAGLLAENEGDLALARREMPLALEGFRAVGDRWGMGGALGSLSAILPYEGRLEEALAMAEEASVCMRELGAVDDAASLQLRALMLRARLGESQGVREAIEAMVRDADEQVSRQSLAFAYSGLADLDRREGRLAQARAHALEGLGRVDGVPGQPPQIEAIVCAGLARVDAALGRLDDAWAWLRRPQVGAAVAFDMPVAAMVAVAAAEVAFFAGDPARAARLLGAADAVRGTVDVSVSDVEGLLASLQEALGPGADAAVTAGRGLDRAAALALLAETVAQPSAAPSAQPSAEPSPGR
ncbi:BTAD domain-containing putative transcriptional regulator [Kineosporia sp. R_H_3]|uniref:BTAD domain-containing putative transcriptional regulator n=1 Tax=Kineosporia sp. R_H_3 TaxID=1961848 RepID=UPI00117BAE0B|nr:BTAD domain-containing putative transcriptional regulator [Kineosporia sp. R_H_3]